MTLLLIQITKLSRKNREDIFVSAKNYLPFGSVGICEDAFCCVTYPYDIDHFLNKNSLVHVYIIGRRWPKMRLEVEKRRIHNENPQIATVKAASSISQHARHQSKTFIHLLEKKERALNRN